ncbi:MAG: sugar ABC transporter permease [Ignavibacteria bacterium RIFCSPLOWO2_02_FULL_55_14]|nr:MAG: sugar ABC transporter permease [Ignavibacteria bacterium GWC2_56_12]OGU65051.1 MAG: sugar ABC transporter permease [Ignavibacteria bacterium RIFCSPHIGHO2_02_FULL_56_12]OGU72350.1 MAG: sugar ABC transporter permease [Ignavibacteria bacterium RIFCSPLOWO2_12_FULL_56_21]OGU72772.1 MAG: sugar ABC transporter permease [Ignavibacteria bacterium RIFCSPLOWO2_02_FULL_55_14]HAV24306.1 sugar ABC transporter permease [Bacteroidota bacterium]
MKLHSRLIDAATHAGLLLFALFLVFPLIWMIGTSFKPTTEIYSGVVSVIPEAPSLDHYRTIFQEQSIFTSMLNSFYVGIASTVIAILIALPGSYALARYSTRWNKIILGWVLGSQIFPVILVMIPLYILLRSMMLTDSLLGLTLVYVVWALPFVLWMLQGYVHSIPVEIEEAASIDGASRMQVIFRIVAPLLLPAVGASVLFAFVSAWNEFFFALVLMKDPGLMTVQVELARFTGMEGQARTGPLAAASVLATVPSVILFGFLQKWFSSGLLAGAVKN